MKERNFIIVVVVVFAVVAAYLFLLFTYVQDIQSGNIFVTHVLHGCTMVNPDTSGNLDITEEMYDFVLVEYGKPAEGMVKKTMRDFCREHGEDMCKSEVLKYCMA